MRLLLVAALVAAAFAARDSQKWNHEVRSESVDNVDSWKVGFDYRFHLDAQVSNGLPVPGSQQSAASSKSLVTLSFPESETVAHMRLEKIRVASLQKEIDEPKNMQPFELFEEIELTEEHLRTLRLPVRFRYENGMVSDIEFDREDLPWSMNIKRVYINMLQVNLAQKNSLESRYNSEYESKKDSVFTAPEVTLEGDCEVVYTVLPESARRERREESELRVTKSINFEKCSRRVGQRYNFRFGDECQSCENKFTGEERNIESSTVFNYRIAGTPSRFAIKEVELRSIYSYAPLSQQETFFTTFVAGHLRLIEVTEGEKRIAGPKSEKKESLLYSMEWEKREEKFLATGDESLLKESGYPEMKNKPEIVSRLIKSMIVKMETEEKGIELAATHEMARIVKVLRLATKEDIKRMHKEISSESQEESVHSQMKDIFTDALALAGTFNTVEHLVEKIRNREVSPLKSATLLKQLTSIRVPSKEIVHQLLSLCKDSRRQPLEHQSCWLTVGSLMNGVCGEHRDQLAIESQEERKCPRDVKEKFVRELVEEFERAETRYEKVLALKTIANSGMDMIVHPLEKIIRDEKEEKTVRVQAIEALRKLRSVLPRKMISVLMPLYKNTREHPEIRVAAFHQMMQTVPEKNVIDQIIYQLEKEPSTQVWNFVYSALEQYSRSEIPCEKAQSDSIKSALRSVRSQSRKMLSSTYKHWTLYNEEHKAGATLNWAALFSNDSVLPKEVMTTLETAFAGQWNKYLAQIGFQQNNIDQVISKLIETVDKKGLEEVLVRGKRSTFKPTEVLRGLFSKLSIVSRKQKEQDPHALVYIRFRDMDYALLPIDEQVIPEIIKTVLRNGRIELGEIESILAKGYRFNTVLSSFVYERTRSIATSMGSPLVFSSKMPTIFKIDGSIKVELEPRNGDSLDGLRLRIQARPALASTHITKVEINYPGLSVSLGAKLLHSAHINVPVDMTTEMSWDKKFEVKTTLALPRESRRLIQLQSRPVSFVRVWPKETRAYVEPKEKTIYVEELETLVHKIRSSHLEKATGMKMNVEGHVHGHIWEKGMEGIPSALLIGENNIEVSFEETEETPKEYVIKTEIAAFDEESRMERPSMERFFEKDNEEHFKTEDHEDYVEDEEERRSSFRNYVKSYKSDKAYSHRLWAQIKSVGGRKERKVEAELKTVCDDKLRHCKIDFSGLTTPLLEKETRDWKIESSIEMLYPEMPETLEELLNQKHRELSINIESRWGSDYKNELKMKIQGEQNKEQKRWMKRVAELRERKEDSLTALEEYSRLVDASMLNQYKVVAKYDIACPVTRSLLERFYVYSKVSAPWFSTSYEFGHNEERIVRALLTIEPSTRQYANLTIETPSEKVSIRDYRLPVPLRLVNIRRQSMTPVRSLSSLGSSLVEESKPMCTVESRKVNSFDDVIYRTPLTTCYSVLAKDCSSEKPEFAVLMKKISKNGEEKKMKIISRDSVIELEMDKRSDKMRVTIDGEKVEKVERLEKARVYKKNEVVVVELDDVTVEFDGYTANVKLSEYYKNKQCGICGHFDGEKKTEFRRADNEETEDLEEFHRSFLLKDSECEIEEEKLSEKRNYRFESEVSSSEEESKWEDKWETKWDKKSKKNVREEKYEKETEVVEPEEKTRVIEYSNRVCFSKTPVPECPKDSYENEENMKEIKVKFTCLSRSDRETARFLRESRREVLSLEDFPESFIESITIPKNCLVY